MTQFDDIMLSRRGLYPGGNSQRFIELTGGQEVPLTFIRPDPNTFRSDYYYNTRTNELFKKVTATCPPTGRTSTFWKKVSEY